MKPLLFTIFLLGLMLQANAQDLIIKQSGDSIPCRIKEVGVLYIAYHYNDNGKVTNGNIATKDVKNFYYNVLPVDSIFMGKVSRQQYGEEGTGIYVWASAGLGYMTAPLPDNIQPFLEEYLNELRSGWSFNGDIAYFFNEAVGVGLHYSQFRTSNQIDRVVVYTSTDTLIGPLSDNIRLSYFAPSVYYKFGNTKQRILPSISAGIGYADYQNNSSVARPFKIKAATLGLHFHGNLEVNLNYNFAIMLRAGVFVANFSEIEITDYTTHRTTTVSLDEPDNNTRFELHGGIRYKFGNR